MIPKKLLGGVIFLLIAALSALAGPPDSINWNLIWQDEFNGDTLDPEKWTVGQEWDQDDCDYPEEPVFNGKPLFEVSNGTLKQKSWKEQSGNRSYIGSVLKTRRSGNNPPLFTLHYGYVEVRMRRTIVGEGFHMNAYTFSYDSSVLASSQLGGHVWPSEIDFAETLSREYYSDRILNALHNTGPDEEYWNEGIDWTEWHTYAFDWHENGYVDFYIDDSLVHSSTVKLVPDYPQYLLLRIGVGGWIGEPNENTEFPGIQEVDWVRAYQKKEVVSIEMKNINNGDVFPEPEAVTFETNTSVQEGAVEKVEFLANDNIIGTITSGPDYNFTWENATVGRYQIKAKGYNTNGGFVNTNSYFITIGDTTGNLFFNPEFDEGNNNWELEIQDEADATFEINSDNQLSGANSAYINIANPGSSSSDITLNQEVYLEEGKDYKLTFLAKADAARDMIVKLHSEEPGNFTNYVLKLAELTTEYQKYEYTFESANTDYYGKLTFSLGDDAANVFIDSVVINTNLDDATGIYGKSFNQLHVYPNPASERLTIDIPNGLKKMAQLKIYSLSGKVLLEQSVRVEGEQATVDISTLLNGSYILEISFNDTSYRQIFMKK